MILNGWDAFIYPKFSGILNYTDADGLPICFSTAGMSPQSACVYLFYSTSRTDSPTKGPVEDSHYPWTLSFVSVADEDSLTKLGRTQDFPPDSSLSCLWAHQYNPTWGTVRPNSGYPHCPPPVLSLLKVLFIQYSG